MTGAPTRAAGRAFPRRRASRTTRKEARRGGGFSRETPRRGLGRERSGDRKPSGVSTCTSREPSPSSSRAYPPRAWRTVLRPQPHPSGRAWTPHSPAWTRAPFATLPSIAGRTVLCRTSAGVRTTTPPRAAAGPRRAACPRRACRGRERPRAAGTGRDAPFGDRGRVPSVPGRDVDLVGLDPALRPRRREGGGGPAPELLGHGSNVGPAQVQPPGDLPVGEVQAREAGAQRPDPRRPAVAGQGGAGQVVEAGRARLAAVALAVPPRVAAPVADHRGAAAPGAADALRPALPARRGVALGVVDQGRGVRGTRRGHGPRPVCRGAAHLRPASAAFVTPSRPAPRIPRRATSVTTSLAQGAIRDDVIRHWEIPSIDRLERTCTNGNGWHASELPRLTARQGLADRCGRLPPPVVTDLL